jgi:hypothetical protein
MSDFGTFCVLVDEPSDQPVLGFDAYAEALSELILESTPQFAVGVFGEWGSGKTTLLRAIDRQLSSPDRRDRVIRVHFNAWRYEREAHLVVPLLDTLREALAEWAAEHAQPAAPARRGWRRWWPNRTASPEGPATQAYRAAAIVGRAARALLAGLSVKAALPLTGTEASLDFSKVVAELRRAGDGDEAARQPLSFYHRAFRMMREAIQPFVNGGRRRIVVFVDDLDRCLPENALEVLESMKLLFDQMGFVFVLGLDKQIIERAIELKYGGANRAPHANPGIRGADYIKKIFQVPYALPRVRTSQIDEYFTALVRHSRLPQTQGDHFEDTVRPHLEFISGGNAVNPREVKRLLNAYVLQLKMLAPKFVGRKFEPEVVLALQAMGFRADWEHLYDALAADPDLFVESLEARVDDNAGDADGGLWLGDEETPVPPSFLTYLRGRGRPLLRDDLETYVSSLESSRSTDLGVVEMQRAVGRLRSLLRRLDSTEGLKAGSELVSEFQAQLKTLEGKASSRSDQSTTPVDFHRQLTALSEAVQRLGRPFEDPAARKAWRDDFAGRLRQFDALLRELRRQTTVGATAA